MARVSTVILFHNVSRGTTYAEHSCNLPSCLVKFVGKDVLVVGKSDNELNDQFTVPRNHRAIGSKIGVFEADTIVLFVDTDTSSCTYQLDHDLLAGLYLLEYTALGKRKH